MLAQIASRNEIPTHRWLDQRDHHHTSYLRSILVRSGLLPPRVESIDRFEVWLLRFIAAAPAEFREVLTAFGRWHVLRRLRMMCERRGEMAATLAGARARVRLGLHFLKWLKARSTTLEQCRQSDIDEWLATSSSAAYHVRPFLMWAARKKLCRRITVPQAVPLTPITPTPEKVRWKLVRRLLTDETLDDTARIAGLLLLLYAQRMSRIRNLTSKDFNEENGEYFGRFAHEWVPLCPALAELARFRLSANARSERCTRADGAVLLFPSRVQYGRAILPAALAKMLADLGVDVRAARLSIENELLRKIRIPQIVAQLTGIHIATAVRKAEALGTSFSRYVADVAISRR